MEEEEKEVYDEKGNDDDDQEVDAKIIINLVCVKITKIYSMLNTVIVDYRLSSYS